MATFQELMKAGSVLHRSQSGLWLDYRPDCGPSQRILVSVLEEHLTDREVEGTVCQVVTGLVILIPEELTSPISRGAKFVDGEKVWNFDDMETYDTSGAYSRVPVYRTVPVRKGPTEGYKREPLGT